MENVNSVANQEIKSRFVNREVFANVTAVMDYLLGRCYDGDETLLSLTDIYNMVYFEDAEGNQYTESQRNGLIEELEVQIGELDWDSDLSEDDQIKLDELVTRRDGLMEAEADYREVYEWWIVSDWLGDKLRDNGEVTVEIGCCCYWGRCTTGQAILLDGVISRICDDLLILDGQQNSWNRKD